VRADAGARLRAAPGGGRGAGGGGLPSSQVYHDSRASSLFSFAFAFDDHDFVQVCEVFFNLFLSFSFLSSSAETFTLDHKSYISSSLLSSHIKFTFKRAL